MRKLSGTTLGKVISVSTRLAGTGGQALPGLIVEKIIPGYLAKMLKGLPDGVVVITGTNGKTTTTKLVVELLKSQGKKVVTNATGSNMTRGITSGVIKHAKASGKLDYDIAVFELDEASIASFVKQVKPRWVLALNVSRDQLDRYGEVDTIAKLIGTAMASASEGVVSNANDPQLFKITSKLGSAKVKYFSASPGMLKYFPSDTEMAAVDTPSGPDGINKQVKNSDVELLSFEDDEAEYRIDDKKFTTKLMINGQHNFLNAAAALALVKQLLPDADNQQLVNQLGSIKTPFGRGEVFKLPNNQMVELVLVKNPASFTQALASYAVKGASIIVAINDEPADGRDTSWLWDVKFGGLAGSKQIIVSGSRAADMALRLQYENLAVDAIEPEFGKAIGQLAPGNQPNYIFATYTCMLQIYRLLNKRNGGQP